MLRALILSFFLFSFKELEATSYQESACLAFLQDDSLKRIEGIKEDKSFQSFLNNSLEQKNTILESKDFHELVSEFHERATGSLPTCQSKENTNLTPHQTYQPEGGLYIFISFSLGEKALLNLVQEAERYGAILVLRGFKEENYKRTVQALQKIILKTGQGVNIDPELFNLFSIASVPTFILAKSFSLNAFERTATPFHDRLQGHVSVRYALETFAKEGDLQNEAKAFLEKGMVK